MSEPKFTQENSALTMTCRVEINIQAKPEVLWNLLTDARRFPSWNSTITNIEGEIREGERLRLHVPGTKRTFTPKVSGVVPGQRMVWSDGLKPLFKGVRSFVLSPRGKDSTEFVMNERFSGVIFAMTKRMLPDFRPIFEAYANDLKREAERVTNGDKGP